MNFESVNDTSMNRMTSVPDAKQNIVRLESGELLMVTFQLPNGEERLLKISAMGWMMLVEVPSEKVDLLLRKGRPCFMVDGVGYEP